MNTPISKTCSATKQDQSKCQAAAIPGSEFCFFHDPSKAEKRREAQAQGGRQNRMKTLEDIGAGREGRRQWGRNRAHVANH